MQGTNDLFLELLRAGFLALLLSFLLVRARHTRCATLPGARLIVAGFALLLLATLLDISDEIPGLERFVLIGANETEAYIETFFGYLPAFLLLFLGFIKIVPALDSYLETRDSLHESEEKFRRIFEGGPDPLVIARADGSGIIDVNPAFVRETGIPREEALGKDSVALNLWVDPSQRHRFMEQLRREGAVINLETQLRRKNGETRICLVSAQIIHLSEIPCMLLSNRDITREKQAETALLEMDRMKSEFISTAAHELRTPLTTILGYTELLLSPDDFGGFSEEKRQTYLREILAKSELLCRIIGDMLDISRIESGHPLTLDLRPCEPTAWLTRIVRNFELLGEAHVFQQEFPDGQPEILTCDFGRLTQVVENLLSNAVKYSPDGGTITLRGEVEGADYVIRVTDRGIGMTPEQVTHVFDKFWRADTSNTAIGGLGLGMSIARQIVVVHGGRIWVDSTPGEGTTVSFSLPLNR